MRKTGITAVDMYIGCESYSMRNLNYNEYRLIEIETIHERNSSVIFRH